MQTFNSIFWNYYFDLIAFLATVVSLLLQQEVEPLQPDLKMLKLPVSLHHSVLGFLGLTTFLLLVLPPVTAEGGVTTAIRGVSSGDMKSKRLVSNTMFQLSSSLHSLIKKKGCQGFLYNGYIFLT